MVNSKDEPRSSSRGNPQCKDIRDVMHNVPQQQRITQSQHVFFKHWEPRLDTELLDIQFSTAFENQQEDFTK